MPAMVKKSRQREAILECLKNRWDHPTADDVYKSVIEQIPNISLGTVYRNLTFLSDKNEIVRISTGLGPDHFDAITTPHCHFICKKCGAVYDIDAPLMDENFIGHIDKNFMFGDVKSYSMKFYGICKNCKC